MPRRERRANALAQATRTQLRTQAGRNEFTEDALAAVLEDDGRGRRVVSRDGGTAIEVPLETFYFPPTPDQYVHIEVDDDAGVVRFTLADHPQPLRAPRAEEDDDEAPEGARQGPATGNPQDS